MATIKKFCQQNKQFYESKFKKYDHMLLHCMFECFTPLICFY